MINQKVYIFDVDGTLTPPRQKINKQFASFFASFCEQKPVFLATGSDYKKVKEQITPDIISKVHGIFTCMGNELWINDEKVYFKELKIPFAILIRTIESSNTLSRVLVTTCLLCDILLITIYLNLSDFNVVIKR